MSSSSPESVRGRNLTEAMSHLAAANSALNAIDLRHGGAPLRGQIKALRENVNAAADACNQAIQLHLRDSTANAQ